MFVAKKGQHANLEENKMYKFLKKFLPITAEDGNGKWHITKTEKKFYTSTLVVINFMATARYHFCHRFYSCGLGNHTGSIGNLDFQCFCSARFALYYFFHCGAQLKVHYFQQGIAVVLILSG